MYQSIYGQFEPEVVENMVEALRGVLITLGVTDSSDDLCVRVAQKMIELVTAGERNPERLKADTLKAFLQ